MYNELIHAMYTVCKASVFLTVLRNSKSILLTNISYSTYIIIIITIIQQPWPYIALSKLYVTIPILLLLLQLMKSRGIQNDVPPLLSILCDSLPPSYPQSSHSTHLLPPGPPMNTFFTAISSVILCM